MGDDFVHGYPHVERVMRLGEEIASEVGNVDMNLLRLAVYLHDIGRRIGEPHAYYSARLAGGILSEWGVGEDVVKLVVNAIEYHSFSYARSRGVKPLSVEAMVLSDADKLDALGIVGFLRVMAYGFENGRSVEESLRHFDEKIFKLKDLLHFDASRRLAEELEARTRTAVSWLAEELGIKPITWQGRY
ncbi:HD domain-containing protein [Infirmifilum lucidum]|uniref:HD domain-containing protein n=2 Tax=Infirmifilum lucidum TaxID=2776706 RepID=A0A7L9FJ12_9CREN|nr:HD domain-containing protein [Infirmifilum lucidum]